MPTPSRVTPGEPLRASRQNELVDAVVELQAAGAGGPVGRYKVGLPLGVFKIMAEGPDAEADYTDERYWVKQAYISNAAGAYTTQWTPAEMTTTEDSPAGLGLYITATNLAELADNAHDLAEGEYVHVYRTRDSQTPGVVRYFFEARGVSLAWTALTDFATISTGASAYTLEYNAADVLVGETRYLARIDTAPIPGGTIIGADVLFDCTARVDWGASDTPASTVQGGAHVYAITEDFNTGTVNWANQPAVGGASFTSKAVRGRASGFDGDSAGYIRADIEGSPQEAIDLAGLAPTDEDWYGIEIRPEPAIAPIGYDRWFLTSMMNVAILI